MRILLTGGSGDLGTMAARELASSGHTIVNLDLKPPAEGTGTFVEGSILDRALVCDVVREVDCIVHIAALHGIHEFRKSATPNQFWDLNVTGTFNLLHAAREADVGRFVFISSTSVRDRKSWYGQTKIISEQTCRAFTEMDDTLSVICLRPRAFIPPWNREVYASFVDWAKWFWGGAVHIDDVSQALVRSVEILGERKVPGCPVFVVDGKYDYMPEELRAWDESGPGSTFLARYGRYFYDLALKHGLDPARKPNVLDISATIAELGYRPSYSTRNLLEELARLP